MRWYAVRSIFLFGTKSDSTNIFEERIVVFEAKDEEEAFLKAEKESDEYAKNMDFKVHSHMELYIQDGDPLIDGYEVWSQMFESNEGLDEFFKQRYEKFKYHPEQKPLSDK
jgi:hypothetical protein